MEQLCYVNIILSYVRTITSVSERMRCGQGVSTVQGSMFRVLEEVSELTRSGGGDADVVLQECSPRPGW